MAAADVTVAAPPRRTVAGRITDLLSRRTMQVVLAIIGVAWLVPTFGLLVASFRTQQDNNATGWWTALAHPGQVTVETYRDLLDNSDMIRAFVNTILITVPSSLLVVMIAALAAYAFAWMRFPGRDGVFLVVVGLLVVPIQIALIPVARIYGELGLFGSIPGVVLFHVAFGLPFAIFLLRNFFIGIPLELLEAARMDGAGELQIFFRVVLPLGIPAIASLLIFQFLWVWNDLLVALVFSRTETAPLTVAIRNQLGEFSTNIDIVATGSFLQLVVPLVVFFAFQRYFVQGLLAGSVK
jgi:alpha-glucoside transport system permease protein